MDRGGCHQGRRRVLIVSAAMGGGHLQVSREVARRLESRQVDTLTVNLDDLMAGPTGRWMRRIYPWMVNQAPWLYDAVFRFFFKAHQRSGSRVGLPAQAALPALRRLCDQWVPDAVVSTFHVAAQAVGRLRAEGSLAAPAVTFVTTFGIHDLWLHPATDGYLCVSEAVATAIAARSSAPVYCCGPVVRPEFDPRAGNPPRPVRPTGVGAGERLALLVAGSLGMGHLERTLQTVAAQGGWTPVVVCGRNEELRSRLERSAAEVVLGWVDDMAGLMAASDVLVDNAAGLTAKEAVGLGLPVVVFRPIPGHGRDDARAMAALGVTEVVNDDRELAAALERASTPGPASAERRRRGQALFVGDAADDICRWLPPEESTLAMGAAG
jgi:UDP-N-acetylglucosamine:LPS N-acetylglucosamine transferase